jgi:hypothetical protein
VVLVEPSGDPATTDPTSTEPATIEPGGDVSTDGES